MGERGEEGTYDNDDVDVSLVVLAATVVSIEVSLLKALDGPSR
jgi:hypothetical protein